MQLVAIDPAGRGPGEVVGRVVDGSATVTQIREQAVGARARSVPIVSISLMGLL
jgi:hypothetical protein